VSDHERREGQTPLFALGATVVLVRVLVRSIETISRLGGCTAALLVLTLIGLMVYEVVVRYVFAAPTLWGYELSTWVMGASFVLAISYALMTDSHVRVDFLHEFLGSRARNTVDVIGYVLFLLPLLLWLSWGMWGYFYGALTTAERSGQSAWNPLIWPFRLALFLGIVTLTLQVVAEVVKSASALAGRPVEQEQPESPQRLG
jgi:TRAP-type mannitol/chloroaromatic compound transport system permease small subunit